MLIQTSKSSSPNKSRSEAGAACAWRPRRSSHYSFLVCRTLGWVPCQLRGLFPGSVFLAAAGVGFIWFCELVSQQLPLLNIQCHERAWSLREVSAVPAIVVIQVAEFEKGKSWIGKDLFSCSVCVMCLCYAKLVWYSCFPFQPWISLLHPSPLSAAPAVKPCEFGCNGPSLVFSPTTKPPHTSSLPPIVCQWNVSSSNWEENGRVTSPCSHRRSQRAC